MIYKGSEAIAGRERTMKLYHSFGMNPRLVRMFLDEKGLKLDRIPIDLLSGENRQVPYTRKNAMGQTPMLELDNGMYLAETGAICEYLEELNPRPSMIGTTPEERAITRMWWRRVEINICLPMVQAFYYKEGYELFKDRVVCLPEAADGLKRKAQKALQWLDGELQGRTYLCGDRFSIADVCLFTYVDQLRNGGQPIDTSLRNFGTWLHRISTRPSATSSLWPEQPMGMRG
jgi:glutathione S-transferase